MQTLQQKREYTVAVLDPAGNVTAIVCSDVPAAERARVAAQILRLPELGIEQVAFRVLSSSHQTRRHRVVSRNVLSEKCRVVRGTKRTDLPNWLNSGCAER